MSTQRLLQAAFIACVLLFIAGIVNLFLLRFETGDVYPPYSSLRADPLGTRALYESLELTHDLKPSRSFTPFEKIPAAPRQTVLIMGVAPKELEEMPAKEWEEIETLANGGTRVVITLYPRLREGARTAAKKNAQKVKAQKGEKHEELDPREKPVSIKERWACTFEYHPAPIELDASGKPKNVKAIQEGGTEEISWHTSLCFGELGPEWQVSYKYGGNAVIIERKFGAGTVVLSADSYFVSNEAMRAERHPSLLSWMIGPSNVVVFEETHLGVAETPGIAGLARKYRLHGMAAALLLLIGLFVWQQSSPLLPPYEDGRGTEIVTTRGAAEGLLMLLRRGIPANEVTKTCLEQWRRSSNEKVSRTIEAKAKQAEAIANDSNLNPVEAYKRIARVLSKRAVSPGEVKK